MNDRILIVIQLVLLAMMNGFFVDKLIGQAPIRIILDTDMGSDCDDVGALALLHAYADMGKVEIIGCIYSSGKVPYGAGIVEAINVRYGRPDIPVGADHTNEIGDSVDKMNAEKLTRDTVAYGHRIMHNTDAIEQTRLNRNILTSQPDGSVTYITIGHTKGLYDLLVSEPDELSPLTGEELIRKKISRWVALGALDANDDRGEYRKDWNFYFNGTVTYTKFLVDHFPSTTYFVSGGAEVMTGKTLKYTEPGNIVRDTYREWLWNYQRRTLDDQRSSWDLLCVYYAVEGLGLYFSPETSGYLEFDVEKGCKWIMGENNRKHHFVAQKPNTNDAFEKYLNDLISRPPRLK